MSKFCSGDFLGRMLLKMGPESKTPVCTFRNWTAAGVKWPGLIQAAKNVSAMSWAKTASGKIVYFALLLLQPS